MRKIRFLLMMLFATCLVGHAQITTGENSSRVIRTGNRAQEGDFGIYLGGTSEIFKNIDNFGNFEFLPLINLKYMYTDEFEYRLGIEWWKKNSVTDDDGDEYSEFESTMMFYPGVAYHFSKSNILDVYAGAELPFGWAKNGYEYNKEDGESSQFNIGLGAFIGLQAYVGNLPLALGVEYGISTLLNTASDGYISEDGMSVEYEEDVDDRVWKLGNQARVTLTYFFKL